MKTLLLNILLVNLLSVTAVEVGFDGSRLPSGSKKEYVLTDISKVLLLWGTLFYVLQLIPHVVV